jgi:hypothetical protein
MVNSRRAHVIAGFALAVLVAASGIMGCGDAGSRAGGGAATGKPDAVVVTYYYLDG